MVKAMISAWLLAALLALPAAAARAQERPPDEEILRLRALVEALRREGGELSDEVARLASRLARLEAERRAAGPAVSGELPADARLRYVLDVALPRLAPEGLSPGAPLYADDAAGVAELAAKLARFDPVLGPIRARKQLAALGQVELRATPAGAPWSRIVAVGLELGSRPAAAAWPWDAVPTIEPFDWLLLGEDFALLIQEDGPLGARFAHALERAAGAARLVHATAYPDALVAAAKEDLGGELAPGGGFRVVRPPAPDGFFARWLGRPLELRAGDVVRAVNGVAIAPGLAPRDLQARVRGAERFELLVVRDGAPVRLLVEPPARGAAGRAQAGLTRVEQEVLVQRIEALLAELDVLAVRGAVEEIGDVWEETGDLLREEGRITEAGLLARRKELRELRQKKLERVRGFLLEYARREVRTLTAAISAGLERDDPRAALDFRARLEARARRLAGEDPAIAEEVSRLLAEARPLLDKARALEGAAPPKPR